MTGSKQHWLLVFNCQAQGLANSLSLLSDRVQVEHYDPGTWSQQREEVLQRLDRYQSIVIAPLLATQEGFDTLENAAVCRLPSLDFGGYHPDFCYAEADGRQVMGPMGSCHSILALAAYRSGLCAADALQLYNARVFEQLGYLQHWADAREQLLARYASFGFDVREQFVQWSRHGAFMHMIVHPKMACLDSIARLLLVRQGLHALDHGLLPHDNLANGPVFPVYPEIASGLGVEGGYRFKLDGRYETIGLQQFLELNFDVYATCGDVLPWPRFRPYFDRAMALLGRAGA